MRVFVGTMECGENEFEKCKEAILSQDDVQVTHFIVSSMPEREAHETLFSEWNKAKADHELFLKVDADTILLHKDVIKSFIRLFESNQRITGAQAWLHDYMTDTHIYGLTCLRNNVTVATRVNKLYPDRADSGHDIVVRGNDLPKELIPAGKHCWYPSERQAFHYGFHRGKKNQLQIMSQVQNAWESNDYDSIRGLCLMGFKLSSKYQGVDYSDEEFEHAFQFAKSNYTKEFIK